jgi:hypothetical protein
MLFIVPTSRYNGTVVERGECCPALNQMGAESQPGNETVGAGIFHVSEGLLQGS